MLLLVTVDDAGRQGGGAALRFRSLAPVSTLGDLRDPLGGIGGHGRSRSRRVLLSAVRLDESMVRRGAAARHDAVVSVESRLIADRRIGVGRGAVDGDGGRRRLYAGRGIETAVMTHVLRLGASTVTWALVIVNQSADHIGTVVAM